MKAKYLIYLLAGALLVFLLLRQCQSEPAPPPPPLPDEDTLPPLSADYESAEYKWGFADITGELVIPAIYDEVRPYGPERLALVRKDGLWYFIDAMGKARSKAGWIMAWPYSEGLARVRAENDSIGYIDPKGNFVIPPVYQDAGDFTTGYAWVGNDRQYGIINTKGETVIPLSYTKIAAGEAGIFIAKKQNQYHLLDVAAGVESAGYERIRPYRNDLAVAKSDGRYGYLGQDSTWVLEPQYYQAGDFQDGRAVVITPEETFALIDTAGTVFNQENYSQIWPAGDSLWLVEGDGKYGAINAVGTPVIPLLFDELQTPTEGFAVYRLGQGWGFLRIADQKPIVPAIYGLAWPFQNGVARVATRQGIGIIDTTGELLFQPRFFDMRDFNNGLLPVQTIKQ